MSRDTLQRALIGLLMLAGLFSSVQILAAARADWQAQADAPEPVSEWDARLARLRAVLPVRSGTIGYVGDWDVLTIDPDSSEYADQETEYILTQYALAPLVLKRGAGFEWVVANLTPPAYKKWRAALAGPVEIFEFGSDFHLIHRLNP